MLANLLDRYDRKARLAPAMLVALPAALLLAAIGWLIDQTLLGAITAALVEFGVPIAMTNYTRTIGKRIEPELWERWGGPPTTQMLRHRGITNPHRLALVHARLAQLVPEVPLPTEHDEHEDAEDADRQWEAIVEAARSRLRNRPSSRLLFEETCNYGFHRNMLGLRDLGLRTSLIVTIAATVGAVAQAYAGTAPILLILVAVTASHAAWGWWRLADDHAHRAASSYAEAFAGALLANDALLEGRHTSG